MRIRIIILTIILLLLVASNLPAKQREIKAVIMGTSGEISLYRESHAHVVRVSNYTADRPGIHDVQGEIKRIAAASAASSQIKRDGRYIAYENGIVKDTRTGLEWKVGPDKDINWNEAKSWVQKLDFDGGRWKMPSIDALKTLYKKGADKRNKTPLLKTTGWWVWSREALHKSSSDAWCYGFESGHKGLLDRHSSSTMRAFAVRSRR